MSGTLFFVVLALVLLAAFAVLATGRGKGTPDPNRAVAVIRSLDIEAFRNLVNPEEEEFLRANLPPPEFRRIKRERARAALVYVRALSEASLQFASFGGAAQRSSDPVLAASGKQIANSAVYLRLRVLDANARLKLSLAFPNMDPHPLRSLFQQYDHAARLLLNHNGLTRAEKRAA